jgi:hypothetical protein
MAFITAMKDNSQIIRLRNGLHYGDEGQFSDNKVEKALLFFHSTEYIGNVFFIIFD